MLEQLRDPMTVLSNLLLPALGCLFCVLLAPEVVADLGPVTVAQFWVLAALTNALFTVAMTVARDRGSPWGCYLQTLPASPRVRVWALVSTVVLMGLAAAVGVLLVAMPLVEHPPPPWRLVTGLAWVLPAGAPFALIGFTLGSVLRLRAVLPVAQAVFLAAAFGGGLLLPATLVVRAGAQVMPTTAALELITAHLSGVPLPATALWSLSGWTLAALIVAVLVRRAVRRELVGRAGDRL